ncbi:hypothetical protein IAD21_01368 [Abditibacteriota bacterium]|nr:hypothetical protein IAD21_01368 [Abditibacteriota bacterium]
MIDNLIRKIPRINSGAISWLRQQLFASANIKGATRTCGKQKSALSGLRPLPTCKSAIPFSSFVLLNFLCVLCV